MARAPTRPTCSASRSRRPRRRPVSRPPAGTGQVYLAWTAATGATGYNIYRATQAGGAYARSARPPRRSYYNKLLTKGSYYCYVVKAYNANKTEGPASNEVCATVQ